MYVPRDFAIVDRAALLAFIEREPFGILVSTVEGKPFATHAPFVVLQSGESLKLGLHVAKANPQWRELEAQNVLAIFSGPHAMISAGWYADPAHSVPTWDYAAVHCSGVARVTNAAGTRRIVERVVARFEESWRIESADPEYIRRLERAIAGIEIAVTHIDASFKFSQNRTEEDRRRVAESLAASARPMDREVARNIRENPPSVAR